MSKTVVNVALVAPCLRWTKLEKSGVPSFMESPELETLLYVAGGKGKGTRVTGTSLSFGPKLPWIFHPGNKQDHV